MRSIAFFNNKGGVGKTSLVYHLSWMFADLEYRIVAADLDPQANLTSMFLEEERLEELWPDQGHSKSVLGAISPILRGIGDIGEPHVEHISDNIGLIVGDLGLSRFEDKLSEAWPKCHNRDEASFRVVSAFYRLLERAGREREANLVLIDVGPNLGAINRAAILSAEYVTIPLAPDLFSLQGLRNLGPTLRDWRRQWGDMREKTPDPTLPLPSGAMDPMGYVVMQHAVRLDRPVKAYARWMARIPEEYRTAVLNQTDGEVPPVQNDPECLAQLKHYHSLMLLAMEARKPMFFLKPADGAIGAHQGAVASCYKDFRALAQKIAGHAEATTG